MNMTAGRSRGAGGGGLSILAMREGVCRELKDGAWKTGDEAAACPEPGAGSTASLDNAAFFMTWD
jgi:hypothetical protein